MQHAALSLLLVKLLFAAPLPFPMPTPYLRQTGRQPLPCVTDAEACTQTQTGTERGAVEWGKLRQRLARVPALLLQHVGGLAATDPGLVLELRRAAGTHWAYAFFIHNLVAGANVSAPSSQSMLSLPRDRLPILHAVGDSHVLTLAWQGEWVFLQCRRLPRSIHSMSAHMIHCVLAINQPICWSLATWH